MARTADNVDVPLQERSSLAEIEDLSKSNSRSLSNEEIQALQVRKTKVFNQDTLKSQKGSEAFEELIGKIKQTKLFKFITSKPYQFHPFWVADFFRRAKIATDEKSFTTFVGNMHFSFSAQFLTEEF